MKRLQYPNLINSIIKKSIFEKLEKGIEGDKWKQGKTSNKSYGSDLVENTIVVVNV